MSTKGKQVQVTLYLSPELARGLKLLSERTHVPQTEYLRQGIQQVLKKYGASQGEAAKKQDRK